MISQVLKQLGQKPRRIEEVAPLMGLHSLVRSARDPLSTKIGLSSGAVTVSSSLRDELTDLGPQFVEMIGSL
jgi:hypothetical protein